VRLFILRYYLILRWTCNYCSCERWLQICV